MNNLYQFHSNYWRIRKSFALLLLSFISVNYIIAQTPTDTWTVTKTHPHPSRVHNSIEVTKRFGAKDSVLYVQFDFSPTFSKFPKEGDKITFFWQRRMFVDGSKGFEIISIIKPRQ